MNMQKIFDWIDNLDKKPEDGVCVPGQDCNSCPLVLDNKYNTRLYEILSKANDKFGDGFYLLVNGICPNLTCCPVCRVDDFTHVEGCWLDREIATKEESK